MGYSAVELTKQLIEIDSSDPGAYEEQIGKFIFKWFGRNVPGADLEMDEVLPGRYNIRAILRGKEEHPILTYICHMDTVVLGEGWTVTSPLEAREKDKRIYGRGSCDMKSGLACAMCALAEIADSGRPLSHSFQVIATVDEEDFMRGAEKAISAGWVTREDFILDGEPTDGEIRVAHKGRVWFELSVKGITAHASAPDKGADAIAALGEMISEIRKEVSLLPVHEELGNTTVTFGMIEGGYRPYVVPDHAKVWIDMRLVPPTTTDRARKIIERAIQEGERSIPGVKGSYLVTGDRPYVEKYDSSLLLARLKEAVEFVTEEEAKVGCFSGYTDTAVISGILKNHNCMSYGPGSLEMAHKPDEFVPIEDIRRCQKVLTKLAEEYVF